MGLALGGRGSSRTLPSPCSQRGWSPTGTPGAPRGRAFLGSGVGARAWGPPQPPGSGPGSAEQIWVGGGCEPPAGGECRGPKRGQGQGCGAGDEGTQGQGEVGMGRTDPAQRGGARTGAALGLGAPPQAEQPPRCPWLGAHSAARCCELGLWEQQRRGLDSGRFGGAHAEQPSGLSSAKSIPTARTRLEHVSGTPGLKRFRRGEPVVPEGSLARTPGGGCCEERARKSP